MKLSELLYKYKDNSYLKLFLNEALKSPNLYAEIVPADDKYISTPTKLFNDALHAVGSKLVLSSKLEIESFECGCLQYYKKKECIHLVCLYLVSILLINPDLFNKEYRIYKEKNEGSLYHNILESISEDLRTNNLYIGQIHLIPIIEEKDDNYELSLKIGFDKDYIIKSISEFIHMTENHILYSYGQKLSFIHSYECLDAISKVFYHFLMNIVHENTGKSIDIKKSQLYRILEIYNDYNISYRRKNEEKPKERMIKKDEYAQVSLNDEYLQIVPPLNTEILIAGVNFAYFIDENDIYTYSYKSRVEGKIFQRLFKINGKLRINYDSDYFIKTILPLVRNDIKIDESFYDKYPIPDIKVNSYFSYEAKSKAITLIPKIKCDAIDRKSPYLKEFLEGYFETIKTFGFLPKDNEDERTISLEYEIKDTSLQYKFLTSNLEEIRSFGSVFLDKMHLKAKKQGHTRITVTKNNIGLIDFTIENTTLTEEEIKEVLKAYHEKKKFILLSSDTILELDEEDSKKLSDFLEDFNISEKELKHTVTRPENYLLKLVNEKDDFIKISSDILDVITYLQNYNDHNFKIPTTINGELRNYQVSGYRWLKSLTKYEFGGILADDMGLGKTLEIISFFESDEANMPSLVVCPMSLVYNWDIECTKWGFSFPVTPILGDSQERERIIKNIKNNKKALYITSYDSLRRDFALYEAKFRFIVADEAQYIKNQYAQKSEAIKSLSSQVRFALTGTPIENGLADLWSIFDFLMPGYLSDFDHFSHRYNELIVMDDQDALYNLKKRVSPFILRRTKKDVLKDLPDKIEEYYYCKMDDKARKIYDLYVTNLKEDLKNKGNNTLALLTRLRQICITPELIMQEAFENTKVNMAVDLIKSSIDAGHRILVFSQFAQSFPIISKQLENMSIQHYILDGSTKAKNRIAMVEEFNKNDNIKVFLVSLKAGGTGLNLVGADMVIHLDPWWNSSAENQATDRAYRIGQEKDVTVIKLICKDTIEEKVIKLQELKRNLADSIVQSDTDEKVTITREDLLSLLD